MNDIHFALRFIASSMAPAVLFVGVGLLLSGLQMKYTTLINVIRLLNRERRDMQESARTAGEEDSTRVGCLEEQLQSLLRRARLIRGAVCWLYASVLLFLLACFAIGTAAGGIRGMTVVILAFFSAGLLSVLTGIVFAYREARLSYDVVAAEVQDLTRETSGSGGTGGTA